LMKDFKPTPLPAELLEHRDMLLSEMRRILGSDILSQGGDTPHQITARETTERGQYQQDRMSRRRTDVSALLAWATRNAILMYRDWANEPLAVRVLGPLGTQVKMLDPSAIPEDLIVSVDVESATEAKKATDMQAGLEYAAIAPTLAPGRFDGVKYATDLGRILGLKNPEKYFIVQGQAVAVPGQVPGTAPMPGEPQPGQPPGQTQVNVQPQQPQQPQQPVMVGQ